MVETKDAADANDYHDADGYTHAALDGDAITVCTDELNKKEYKCVDHDDDHKFILFDTCDECALYQQWLRDGKKGKNPRKDDSGFGGHPRGRGWGQDGPMFNSRA